MILWQVMEPFIVTFETFLSTCEMPSTSLRAGYDKVFNTMLQCATVTDCVTKLPKIGDRIMKKYETTEISHVQNVVFAHEIPDTLKLHSSQLDFKVSRGHAEILKIF